MQFNNFKKTTPLFNGRCFSCGGLDQKVRINPVFGTPGTLGRLGKGEGVGEGLGLGDGDGDGDGLGLGDGEGSGLGNGEGDGAGVGVGVGSGAQISSAQAAQNC